MFSTVLTITSPCPYRNLKPHHLHEANAPCTAPSLGVSRICPPLVRPASSASTALPLEWPKQRKERSRARFQSEGCQAQKRRMHLVHHHTPASSASEKTARLLTPDVHDGTGWPMQRKARPRSRRQSWRMPISNQTTPKRTPYLRTPI